MVILGDGGETDVEIVENSTYFLALKISEVTCTWKESFNELFYWVLITR